MKADHRLASDEAGAFSAKVRSTFAGSGNLRGHSAKSAFAGWQILIVAVATSILTGPGQTVGVSVFIDPMVETLGVSRSAVSGAYLIGTLAGASAMPFFGRFVDRRGVRLAQVLVGLGFTIALLNMAAVRHLVWLAIGFGGIRMLGQGALSMIPTVSVSVWFDRRRGLAMGLLSTLAGAGLALTPIGLNAIILATSWRTAWLVSAAIVFVTVIPIGWFGLIDRPADVGQVPDGTVAAPDVTDLQVELAVDRGSYTRGEAVRTSQFWILAMISSVAGMLITGLNFHQIDLLSEAGLSSREAAAMFLPQIVGSSVMGISTGYVMDRFGVRLMPAFAMVLLVGVHLLASRLGPGPAVFAYAVSLGATGGTARAAASTMLPRYFGTGHIGSIQGIMTVTNVAGSAVGPVTLAIVEDRLGSYEAANTALIVIPAVAVLLACLNRSLPPRSKAEVQPVA